MVKRPRLLSKQSSRSLSIALTLAISSGLVASTSASFNGSTSNPDNTLSTASLTAPAGLSAVPAGDDVALAWGAGSFGGGTGFGHRVMSHSMGVEADPRDGLDGPAGTCGASDAFTTTAARTAASVTSATHANAALDAAGSWACYRADAEYPAAPAAGQWYSQNNNPTATVLLGHVVRSVVGYNGGDASRFDDGDSFVLTFNQAVNIATGPVSTNNQTGTPSSGHDVCIVSSSGMINIGRTQIGTNCATTQAVSVGRLMGLTMSPGGERGGYHATYTWSDCPVAGQCNVLTVLVGRRYRDNKNVDVSMTSASLAPTTSAGTLTSTTGAAICATVNTATSTCRPVPTGTM